MLTYEQFKTMQMKKAIIIFLINVFGMQMMYAQETDKSKEVEKHKQERKDMPLEQRVTKEVQNMTKKLSLTNDQQSKWKMLATNRAQTADNLKSQLKLTTDKELKKSLHLKLSENENRFNASITDILDEKQKAAWSEIKAKRDKKKEEHKAERKEAKQKEKEKEKENKN
jgi:hypothetical protein